MIGGDYGELIRNGVVSWTGSVQAQIEVVGWARLHAAETGHTVKMRHYMSMEFDASEMDADMWRALTGG